MKTDMKLLSDSWFIDDEINKQEEDEASGDSTLTSQPLISALGEEAVAIAQQRGAEKQKKKQEEKDRKEATRIKRMSQLPHTNRKVQKKVGSRSGSFNVAPSPSKTVPAASSSLTSTSPFKVSDHRQNTEGAKKQLFQSKNTVVDFDTILNVEELTFEETHLSDFMGDLSAPSPSTLGQQSTFPPAVAKKTTASPANATPKPVGTSQTYKVKYVAPSFGSRKSKVSKAKEYPAAAPAFQTTPTEVMDMSAEKPTEKVLRPHALPVESNNLTRADDETSVSPSKTGALTPVDTLQIYGDKNVATDEASGAPKDSHAEKYPAATTAERANIVEKVFLLSV
ncbi:hypothetical protein OUZ56_026394 [Daphnia magna]|uniref:Uncharacterized protein n=1 Tax=Daphnia magna TaxID=35525 RepID=A0ABQ9ZMD1_9CRUS|nr:hypothetical protein OUZ56_026394 [Daphnia magna]